jgi:leucyl aminopeptidase
MDSVFAKPGAAAAVPIWFVTSSTYPQIRDRLDAQARAFAAAAGFEPKPGRHLLLPGGNSAALGGVLFGVEDASEPTDPFLPGRLAQHLPNGTYRFANAPHDARLAALAFALGSYRFTRYRKAETRHIALDLPQHIDRTALEHIVEGVTLARDLINTPANDMGPADLEQAARELAARHGASVNAIVGDDLLTKNFPLIHAVGRAAATAPRLIDLSWGDATHPRVTLVGKGVCFDTGGLDIKPDAGMLNMKKDMGGAATALALAHMIMAAGLRLRLRVLIPAVENSIAGSSFRPRDIYKSRKGITVEIGNTDAEGRLILADALALADEDKPDLVADFATLTGAARVALGPDVPAFFTDDDALANELMTAAAGENDPLWRLPLWRPYESMLESKVADINNVGGSQGGAITAALFMRRFVSVKSWLHVDVFAWTPAAKPGRPEGGECQAARALYAVLAARYRAAG